MAAPAAAQSTTPAGDAHSPAVASAGEGGELRLAASSGIDFSSGDYGAAEKTKILVVPLSLRAAVGSLRLSATLPYLRIDSPGIIVGGGTGGPIIVDPNAPARREVREGLGDVSVGATYTLPTQVLGLDVDLTGRVKLPTSSRRKALGTGKTDVTLRSEFSKQLGTWAPFVTIGYRFLGDPEGVDLRNSISTSIGTTKRLGTTVLIASYDYARATSAASADAHELFGALSGPLASRVNWTTYGIAGLSEGSPDYGVGLLLTFKLN